MLLYSGLAVVVVGVGLFAHSDAFVAVAPVSMETVGAYGCSTQHGLGTLGFTLLAFGGGLKKVARLQSQCPFI